jgi:hypothetical protein
MKTLKNYLTLIILLIGLLGNTIINAQEWTSDQKAVWQEVENMWAKWKANEIDEAFANVHEQYLGWNNSAPMPISKDKWVNSMKDFTNSISNQNYNIEPARIVIYKNVAVVHYYFEYSFVINRGDTKVKHSNSGKWSAFFVLEKSLWFLIGDFTFTEPINQPGNSNY